MKSIYQLAIVSGLILATSVQAAVIPGRWQKIDSLAPGTRIIVTMKSEDRLEGSYQGSDPGSITIEVDVGRELRLPKTAIARIESGLRSDDRLLDGTLIGAGVGFGAGFFGLAAFNAKATASGPIWDGEALGYYTAAGLLGAGVGALTGALVDSAHSQRVELYRSS